MYRINDDLVILFSSFKINIGVDLNFQRESIQHCNSTWPIDVLTMWNTVSNIKPLPLTCEGCIMKNEKMLNWWSNIFIPGILCWNLWVVRQELEALCCWWCPSSVLHDESLCIEDLIQQPEGLPFYLSLLLSIVLFMYQNI